MSALTNQNFGVRTADLVVLIVLMFFAVSYGVDAWQASTHVYNLILVLPLTVLVTLLCLVQLVLEFFGKVSAKPRDAVAVDTFLVVALFTIYVLTLGVIGLDVGTMLFVAVFLWIRGERRVAWLLGYSISLSFSLAWFFSKMLPYPMPMLILPGTG